MFLKVGTRDLNSNCQDYSLDQHDFQSDNREIHGSDTKVVYTTVVEGVKPNYWLVRAVKHASTSEVAHGARL